MTSKSSANTPSFTVTKDIALEFHKAEPKGKLHIGLNKSLTSMRDLSLAYSPGVGFPCLEIKDNEYLAYEYTSKGNFVAVISNGTAILGFGDLGYMASKPVMEGKAVLMKRFADVDSVDILVKTKDPKEFVNVVQNIGNTWGGINLEDIKAPECFIIETELKKLLNIPVFHDDQHGTAVVTLAGIINAVKIVNKDIKEIKIIINGSGAAGIACANLLKSYGVPHDNIIMCDTKGVIYSGREDGMNPWKKFHAVETNKRTLAEAAVGADILIGLSANGAFTKEMVASMNRDPIIFAMANPDPEILPSEVREISKTAIIATGRSDYPNQVNNVLCFPYLFRGALDSRATEINEEMKLAVAMELASIAQEKVTETVQQAIGKKDIAFGPDYIIPTIFDTRLPSRIASAVVRVAKETGIARVVIDDMEQYVHSVNTRLGIL